MSKARNCARIALRGTGPVSTTFPAAAASTRAGAASGPTMTKRTRAGSNRPASSITAGAPLRNPTAPTKPTVNGPARVLRSVASQWSTAIG
jgi:hypothetical protein